MDEESFTVDTPVPGLSPDGVDSMVQEASDMQSFMTIFIIVAAIIVIGGIATAIYRFRAARRAGLDPLAPDISLASQALHSPLMQGTANARPRDTRDIATRLAEVDELFRSGTIDSAERQRARDRIIGEA